MPYLKVMPEYSLGNIPAVLKPEPIYGGFRAVDPDAPYSSGRYIRGSLPWSYRGKRRLRSVGARPLYSSPVYSQYAPVRGRIRAVASPPWRQRTSCPPGLYCSPTYSGFGADATPSPFIAQPDPVAAFIRGLQNGLGAQLTGTWDKATHDALAAYMTSVSTSLPSGGGVVAKPLPTWGTSPAAVGNLVAMLPVLLALPGSWANPAIKAADFAAGWGIPATNAAEMAAWLTTNQSAVEAVIPAVDEQIVIAETGKCSTWLTTGFIGATALIVGGAIGYVIWGRKK